MKQQRCWGLETDELRDGGGRPVPASVSMTGPVMKWKAKYLEFQLHSKIGKRARVSIHCTQRGTSLVPPSVRTYACTHIHTHTQPTSGEMNPKYPLVLIRPSNASLLTRFLTVGVGVCARVCVKVQSSQVTTITPTRPGRYSPFRVSHPTTTTSQ